MNQKLPIPTDNIYKFYALFGLALLFVCVIAFISIYNTHLDKAFETHQELEILKKLESPTDVQKVRIEILERKSEIYPANKEFYMSVVHSVAGISIVLIVFGFFQWQFKIQPLQDELLAKQIEKARLEIKVLNSQINQTPFRRQIR